MRPPCRCTLAWKPLSIPPGPDGSGGFLDGITTCFFDAPNAFQALGLSRGAAYIAQPANDTGRADSNGEAVKGTAVHLNGWVW